MALSKDEKMMLVAAVNIYVQYGSDFEKAAAEIAEVEADYEDRVGVVTVPVRAFMAVHTIVNVLMNEAIVSGMITEADYDEAIRTLRSPALAEYDALLKRVATRH